MGRYGANRACRLPLGSCSLCRLRGAQAGPHHRFASKRCASTSLRPAAATQSRSEFFPFRRSLPGDKRRAAHPHDTWCDNGDNIRLHHGRRLFVRAREEPRLPHFAGAPRQRAFGRHLARRYRQPTELQAPVGCTDRVRASPGPWHRGKWARGRGRWLWLSTGRAAKCRARPPQDAPISGGRRGGHACRCCTAGVAVDPATFGAASCVLWR